MSEQRFDEGGDEETVNVVNETVAGRDVHLTDVGGVIEEHLTLPQHNFTS